MKCNIMIILLLLTGLVFCCEDFNGGFEKCMADRSGRPQPVDWVSNQRVTKKAITRLTKESGCFRSGNFGLLAETEEGGMLSFRSLKMVSVQPGDRIKMQIYAKGIGKYTLQYLVYGVDDPKKNVFLQTQGFRRTALAKEGGWELFSVSAEFVPSAKMKKMAEKFAVLPVICVLQDSEIVFDDFSFEIIPCGK